MAGPDAKLVTNLYSLPDEVLDEIIVLVPNKRLSNKKTLKVEKKDLISISFTSKRLRRVVESHLYKDIEFDYRSKSIQFFKQLPIHLLLRTLLHRPELFSYIESLELSATAFPRSFKCLGFKGPRPDDYLDIHSNSIATSWTFWASDKGSHFSSSDMKLASELVHSLGPSRKDEWIQRLHEGSFKFFTALLLSQLVRLKETRLHAMFCTSDGFMPLLFNDLDTVSLRNKFPNVQQLVRDIQNYVPHNFEYSSVDEILAYLALPSIKSLTNIMPGYGSINQPVNWPEQIPSTNLTSLILKSYGAAKDLGQILRATPNLAWLEFHHFQAMETEYNCSDLNEALLSVQHCLECLIISISAFDIVGLTTAQENARTPVYSGKLDSLKNFKKLRYLKVPLITVLGWHSSSQVSLRDSLPDNLQELCLSDDWIGTAWDAKWSKEDFLWWIREYLERKNEIELRLEIFSLRGPYFFSFDFNGQEQNALDEICDAGGKSFQLFDSDGIDDEDEELGGRFEEATDGLYPIRMWLPPFRIFSSTLCLLQNRSVPYNY